MRVCEISLNKKTAQGIEIPLRKTPLVLVVGSRGYLMCGYLDIKTAEKMGDRAAVIKGVSTVNELLEGKIAKLTSHARKAGIKVGISGLDALSKII